MVSSCVYKIEWHEPFLVRYFNLKDCGLYCSASWRGVYESIGGLCDQGDALISRVRLRLSQSFFH